MSLPHDGIVLSVCGVARVFTIGSKQVWKGEMSSILGRGKMTARPAGVEWMPRRWLQPPARENLHGARGNCAQVRALVRRGPPNSARFGTRARKWGVRSYADALAPPGSETVMEGKSPGAREVSAEVIVLRRREREFCYGEGEGTDNLGPPASRHCTRIWNVPPHQRRRGKRLAPTAHRSAHGLIRSFGLCAFA